LIVLVAFAVLLSAVMIGALKLEALITKWWPRWRPWVQALVSLAVLGVIAGSLFILAKQAAA
jgi:hypothetical protein